MRFLIAGSIVALVVTAGAQAGPARGTLTGAVTRGPIAPVCVAEQPCDGPAANVTLAFVRNGSVVRRVVTDGRGHYRLTLPAGSYSVRRARYGTAVDPKLEPNRVRVFAGRVTQRDFSIDTGIR